MDSSDDFENEASLGSLDEEVSLPRAPSFSRLHQDFEIFLRFLLFKHGQKLCLITCKLKLLLLLPTRMLEQMQFLEGREGGGYGFAAVRQAFSDFLGNDASGARL